MKSDILAQCLDWHPEAIVADDFGEMKLLIARFDVSFVEGELIELEEHLLYVLFLDAGN